MRERFGVSVAEFGGAVPWREAVVLVQALVEDTGSLLGAAVQGWAYPASHLELITLAAVVRDKKAFESMTPWALAAEIRERKSRQITDEVRAAAEEKLRRMSGLAGLPGFE